MLYARFGGVPEWAQQFIFIPQAGCYHEGKPSSLPIYFGWTVSPEEEDHEAFSPVAHHCWFCFRLHRLFLAISVELSIARSRGIYRSAEESMRAIIERSYSADRDMKILYAGTNSFDGPNRTSGTSSPRCTPPHVRMAQACPIMVAIHPAPFSANKRRLGACPRRGVPRIYGILDEGVPHGGSRSAHALHKLAP